MQRFGITCKLEKAKITRTLMAGDLVTTCIASKVDVVEASKYKQHWVNNVVEIDINTLPFYENYEKVEYMPEEELTVDLPCLVFTNFDEDTLDSIGISLKGEHFESLLEDVMLLHDSATIIELHVRGLDINPDKTVTDSYRCTFSWTLHINASGQ